MATCTGLTSSILLDCAAPITGGTKDVLYLINQDELDTITYADYNANGSAYPPDVTDGVVSGITLLAGKKAYKVEGRNNSNEPMSNVVKSKYFSGFSHEVRFKVFDNNPLIKEQIANLVSNGKRVLAVVENNHQGPNGESAFELYGVVCGLVVSEGSRNLMDADTQGGYDILVKTNDGQTEPKLPVSIFNTNYTTTKALIEALTV